MHSLYQTPEKSSPEAKLRMQGCPSSLNEPLILCHNADVEEGNTAGNLMQGAPDPCFDEYVKDKAERGSGKVQ